MLQLSLSATRPTLPLMGTMVDRGPSILVIEDNEAFRNLVARYLDGWECTVVLAGTSKEALDKATQSQFDLFIIDIRLNERLTGVDVLQELRDLPGYDATPAIACTVHTGPRERQRLLDIGFDGHLGKPFTADELWESVCKTLARVVL